MLPPPYHGFIWHSSGILLRKTDQSIATFMLDKKELSLHLEDFRTIFNLLTANDNNHNSFMPPPLFYDMVPFYKQQLGFTMELKTSSSFKTTGLLQPWQAICKTFSKCLTTRVTGWDQPLLQIMQIMNCFVNNIHVDYAELLWEGIYYSLHHPTSSIPYPRFTKIIISHYMTSFPEISRHVPLTQSQPTESTQGTHRTLRAPRSPTPKKDTTESSAPKRSTVIRFRLPKRRSTRLTPPALVSTVDKADEMILQDTLQILGTRLKPRSDKESPEVEITNDEEVEITNVVILVNVNEEEEEITDESVKNQVPEQVRDQVPVYVAEGLIMERQKTKEEMEWMIAKAILQERGNIQAEISSQIQKAIDHHIPSQVDASMKFENLQVPQNTCRPSVVRPRDQDDPHDDAHPKGENSAKRQKTSEYEAYVSGESSSGQIVARRANECIVSITEPDYKNLNKNDIKDMYLMIMNGNAPNYVETGLLWSLSVFIRSSVIWKES
ncbi:hypothetical protein Tco_1507361 [Tanacetum coccineum]